MQTRQIDNQETADIFLQNQPGLILQRSRGRSSVDMEQFLAQAVRWTRGTVVYQYGRDEYIPQPTAWQRTLLNAIQEATKKTVAIDSKHLTRRQARHNDTCDDCVQR